MPARLSDKDFDAYQPSKWRSNVFNRERLEVKQNLLALARELPSPSAADGSPLLLEASAEHPALWNHKQVDAQHLFYSRHQAARREIDGIIDRARPMSTLLDDPTPQRNHLFLDLCLRHDRVEVALRLHPDAQVDRQNLVRKLDEAWERERFFALVHALPDGTTVGVHTGTHAAAATLDDATLGQVLADLAKPAPAHDPASTHWLSFTISLPRADALAAGDELAARLAGALTALTPLYQFIAWSRDNDFVSMREQLKQEKVVKRQKGLGKHDRVTIVRGMFAGRTGVIQEIDARGTMKVLVGTVAVKLTAEEVERQ